MSCDLKITSPMSTQVFKVLSVRKKLLSFIIRHQAEKESILEKGIGSDLCQSTLDLSRLHQSVGINKIPITLGSVFFWLMSPTGPPVDKILVRTLGMKVK